MKFKLEPGVPILVVNQDGRKEERTSKHFILEDSSVETDFDDGIHVQLPDNSQGWLYMVVPPEAVQCIDIGTAPPIVGTAIATRKDVPDLRYTVVFEDESYKTIRIETVQNEFKNDGRHRPSCPNRYKCNGCATQNSFFGKRIVSYLYGPDNSRNFRGFGEMKRDGSLHVWKRFKVGDFPSEQISPYVAAFHVVTRAEDTGEYTTAYAMRSGKCAKCGRDLTVPASLNRGMGPVCAAGGEDE